MKDSIVLGLIQNTAILLAFAMLYDYFWTRTELSKRWYLKVLLGFVIGGIGIVLMLTPWTLYPGLVFDTRSILLAVSGLFFGSFPTIIAIMITAAFRIFMGGDGMWMGIAVIVSSGLIGIIWRQFRKRNEKKNNALELLLLGLLVHIVMLGCTLFLPEKSSLLTFKKIFWPVILIYPVGTMLLGSLMYRQNMNFLMQKALDESEERWKFALEGSRDGIWDWNTMSNKVYFSHQWKAMLGYDDHEIGNSIDEWDKRVHLDDKERVYKDLNRHLKGETSYYASEHRVLCKDGTYKWILDRGKVIEWTTNKEPVRLIGTHSDISDRKLAEKELQKFSLVVRQSSLSLVITDINGHIEFANPKFIEIAGYELNELIGKNSRVLKSGNKSKEEYKELWDTIKSGKVWKGEFLNKKKNGELYNESASIFPLFDENHKIINFVGIKEDISVLKSAEKDLQESNYQNKILFDYAPIPIWEEDFSNIKNELEKLTAKGVKDFSKYFDQNPKELEKLAGLVKIIAVNKKSMEFYGVDDVAQLTSKLNDWFVEESWQVFKNELVSMVNGDTKYETEIKIKSPEGIYKYLFLSLNIPPDSHKTWERVFVSFVDITERKEAEESLEKHHKNLEKLVKERTEKLEEQSSKLKESQTALLFLLEDVNESGRQLGIANEKLAMANKEMEAFSYSVSHDLRAPLTRLDGFSTALVDLYKDKLDEKGVHYLNRIKVSSQKMEQLINDMLALSRISRQGILKTEVNISSVSDKILKDLKSAEPNREAVIKIEKSIKIFCDSKLITILLENMLTNAWKFTSKNTKTIIEIGTKLVDNKKVVFIKDNGVGFDIKYVDKVFLPFQRLHTENEFAGTGIGMATVSRIIKRHDAEIEVESKIDEGSTFYLIFKS
ncbi:MAG: PAS domain S-box protein [Bacteroidales bacterium]|jgi:PAS domain S-box-containing protein|nr:PAS domain S-box protein [Bacteroidales bacterium]